MPTAQQGLNISDSAQIQPGVIQTTDLADDAVTKAKIAADQVEASEVAAGAVGTSEIANDSVINEDIKSDAAIAYSKLNLADNVRNADIKSDAAIVDTKLAQITTASKVSGAALTSLASIPAGAGLIPLANLPATGGSALTLIPRSIVPLKTSNSVAIDTNTVTGNTTMRLSQFIVEHQITVNKLSFYVNGAGVAGTVDVTVYSEDGQTQKIAVTSGTISAGGVQTIAVSAVILTPGIYWIAINANSTTNITPGFWSSETDSKATSLRSIASEPDVMGTLTITADTPAATFDPTDITAADTSQLYIRLDT